jgi:demethylmenaquinone methyltransferase/2-methoxy-6-polyprenyl-1,4-benzoquinol methylase
MLSASATALAETNNAVMPAATVRVSDLIRTLSLSTVRFPSTADVGQDDPVDRLEEQIEYYKRRAGEYDETSTPEGDPFAGEGAELAAALTRFEARGRVLEIACGTGQWTQAIVRFADHLTALDSSEEMIEFNRAKLSDDRVDYVVADFFSWEPDERYDVVVFANWLSHVPLSRFDAFWERVERALAVGGRVFFTDESADAWRHEEFIDQHVVRRTLNDGSEFQVVKIFWEPSELEERLRALGWGIEVHRAGPFHWGAGGRVIDDGKLSG